MGEPDQTLRLFREFQYFLASEGSHKPVTLKDGGGGGTSGGMEERIARLEAHAEHMLAALKRLDDVPAKLAVVEEQLRHVPTIAKMWSAAIAIVVALGAVIALAVRFIPHAA